MARQKTYTQAVVDVICEHLEMRACDSWDDNLWPAANTVLSQVVEELRDIKRDIAGQAWARFKSPKEGHTNG